MSKIGHRERARDERDAGDGLLIAAVPGARVLSIIFAVDGLFLAVTVAYGYAYNTYGLVSFIPQ